MKDSVKPTPHPEEINLKDLVVDAPIGSAKPGETIPKPKMKKIKAPTTEQTAPQDTAPNEKADEFALKLLQPLASMPPSEHVLVQPAPTAQPASSDAPHYYHHVFIMEQLDKFVENLFDGEVASLPIPSEVISQASVPIEDIRNDLVEINDLIGQLKELDNRMKDTTTKKYTSVMICVCHSRSCFLSCMYIHDNFMTESR